MARRLRWVVVGLMLVGCGRSELDDGARAPGKPPAGIPCGTATCPRGQQCCGQRVSGQTTSVQTCAPLGQACPLGVVISCTDGSFCSGGEACCLGGGGANAAALCTAADQCRAGMGQEVLCATAADCPAGFGFCCPFPQVGYQSMRFCSRLRCEIQGPPCAICPGPLCASCPL